MNKKTDILSIGVISRFRSTDLKRCLESISRQTVLPREVLLVLDSRDSLSIGVVTSFKTLPVKILCYGHPGYAVPRNKLLKNCRTRYLYMVDDDCVLGRNNIKNILNYMQRHSHVTAVQGSSVNKDVSFYSQFMQWTYELWNNRLLQDNGKLLTLDTKNIAFNLHKMNGRYPFNECFGSEDIDFGLQLTTNGQKIGYCPKIIVSHFEHTLNLLGFVKKKLRMRRGRDYILSKWDVHTTYSFSKKDETILRRNFNNSKYKGTRKYRIIFNLLMFLRSASDKLHEMFSEKQKVVLCVTSPGGHLYQMSLLREWWGKYQRYWVTSDSPDVRHLLKGEEIVPGNFPENANPINALRNLFLAFKLFLTKKPSLVVSMGAGIAPPFFLVAKIFGVKTAFIETLDFVHHGSLSGRLIYPLASLFFVQHRSLKKIYPKAKYIGNFI